ncbi:MAG: type I-MYXAN CRISPR-associated Cas8a1/Cmx1 [Pyrinomonadaceae bacterium MAG19_C2-C3]|nr:type I-MYXAN CRISPR-associated Cas8a1/Cmx1 [Pyrinomonadaceae bacterium MAG19_C2-C3]
MAELNFQLTNPNYTIYHRAALGGLAATIRAWGEAKPEGIEAEVTKDRVCLAWKDELADQEAVRRVLAASFKLTKDKMIDLPGQGLEAGTDDLRLAIHNGITGTFLQHPKMRPGEKEPRKMTLKTADDDAGVIFTYKAIDSYAHQKAQGTGLLETKLKGKLPVIASIPQSIVPGATSGALELQAAADEVILLMFLMVGCPVFLLRPRTYGEKAQSCVIVPDVIDLIAFSKALKRTANRDQSVQRFSNSYLGRVVGGAEEAALRFLIDMQAADISSERSIAGCLAIAMGKVAWDANQVNRSMSVKLKSDYDELNIYRAAQGYLGNSKIVKSKKGDGYAIPASPVPELIAANLAAERHWCANFKSLVSEKKDFGYMRYAQGGLNKMKDAVKDADDKAIIRAFQDAWKMTMRGLYERANRDGLFVDRLLEVEREKMRNAILRAKTADALAGWFLRFCADATKGNSLGAMRDEATRIRDFIFNPRNFERFQNLCLFALVSYASDTAKSNSQGEN